MREVCIAGVGLHPWGIFKEKSMIEMAIQATNDALKDAGMTFADMEMIVDGGSNYVPLLGRGMLGNVLSDLLGSTGVDIITIHGGCAGSAMVYHNAWLEVASGRKDVVLCVGADKNQPGLSEHDYPADLQDRGYVKAYALGMGNPAYWAMNCRRRMIEYGTTPVQLAKVAVKAKKNGVLNPYARYHKAFTVEEVLASPMVADPLTLLMVCPFSHGAAAVVMCSKEKAKKLTTKPVYIAATAMASQQFGEPQMDTVSASMNAVPSAPYQNCSSAAVWRAYEEAGIGPKDVSFAEVGDTSVWDELVNMEGFGLCKPGEAEKLVEKGETEIGGRIPINPSGGFQSFGEATAACGIFQLAEATWQLRGQAGQRQVKNPKVALCQVAGLGPNAGAAILKV